MPEPPDFLNHVPLPKLKMAGVLAAAAATAVLVVGILIRFFANQSELRSTQAASIPAVKVIRLMPARPTDTLVLPGDVEAYYVAPVYARTTGYLRNWYADIGKRVRQGEVIADIDAPDLDQQVEQARGDLEMAIANEKLAAIEDRRYIALGKENAISQEMVDEKIGTYQADIAATDAARADLQQLLAEQSFEKIISPFDGVVTTRTTDIGALITVGLPTETPLFTIADEHRLRVYVHVPQNESALIRLGTTATFAVPQYPRRIFHAVLVTTSKAIDTTSGTLNLEFQADNPDGALVTGAYAQVHIVVPSLPGTMVVPASALLFRNRGMAVATVNAHDRVVLKPIVIGLDDGRTVEVPTGLGPRDRVIDNPPDFLRNNDLVRVVDNARD